MGAAVGLLQHRLPERARRVMAIFPNAFAQRAAAIERLLAAVDAMDNVEPDGSQRDADAWDELWEARQAVGCLGNAHARRHQHCILR